MSISIPGQMDDPVHRAIAGKVFFMAFIDDIQGPKGPKMLDDYMKKAIDIARNLGDRTFQVLTTERDRDEAAGRLKYVASQLLILEGCAKAAQTTEGNCRTLGLQCMAFIDAELKGLAYSLDTYTPKAA